MQKELVHLGQEIRLWSIQLSSAYPGHCDGGGWSRYQVSCAPPWTDTQSHATGRLADTVWSPCYKGQVGCMWSVSVVML